MEYKNSNKIKYFLYARKSSESEDRQIQSIDDQINRLKKLATDFNLNIKEILTEAHSAKKPGARPVFNQMLKRIEKGEADGILCWQINRLSRNPVDSAKVQWLLQQGTIKSIQTIDGERRPEDNAVLFSVEAGVSNQYIIDLSKNVRRGMASKLEKGWLPCLAPPGYLNDLRDKTIIKDFVRFDLVKKMWGLMLTGCYSPRQILKIATSDWGYRTRKTARTGNKELSLSGLYRIFDNPFYCGIIRYGGRQYLGKHKAMIKVEDFDRVQELLGRKTKSKIKKHIHSFTGIIRCGECGCLITAEHKTKFIKSTGKLQSYIYYHCTRKKKHINCSQHKYISERKLENQIENKLKEYEIIPFFRNLALEFLNQDSSREIAEQSKIIENRQRTLVNTQRQLDNLTRMRYQDLIGDDEFIRERDRLKKVTIRLQATLNNNENITSTTTLTKSAFDFATYAREAFKEGSPQDKKEIFLTLGQNPTLKDGKLNIQANIWLSLIQKSYKPLFEKYQRLEPKENLINKGQNKDLDTIRTQWSTTIDVIRTKIREFKDIQIADLKTSYPHPHPAQSP